MVLAVTNYTVISIMLVICYDYLPKIGIKEENSYII